MTSGGRAKTNATPAEQLAAENDWLAGRHLPESFSATLPEPTPARRGIAKQIQAILIDPRLVPLLRIVEEYNSRPRSESCRRGPEKTPFDSKTPFLLAPHLRQVLISVQARNELRQQLPVLDHPAAEVRTHLQEVARDCEALAKLIRKGPQPHVALAAETNANKALRVFNPLTELFEASDGSERQVVSFTGLLERAVGWYNALADHVPRSKQNRHTGNGALRVRAAEFLPGVFRKRLGHSYHAHVATIATIVSQIPTDADFVKKIEARRNGAALTKSGAR